ncbi:MULTISPECIES: DUF2199 domain-containing protein [unclassified Caulobacter]|uniref:DUF2199 domain-containing protein n=1 Tax=unclassified Caulobacter TaxID=2648921 RepID=UPI000D38F7A7|nr:MULTISPECIES: DUF2199 domain-containing protein [unclassified Caulobacter]PTS89019.1 DUF2199 domain-containing protein [Caulobacter sp. HMWF009]PTT05540.1 DUF2199 domain-containing protein [Caulobacter sp. HMWF025]
MFRFKCASCDDWHEGMPGFGASAPLDYYAVPDADRDIRCDLTADTCVIDQEFFFVRGCIETPVDGADEPFIWGVWVSLNREHFEEFLAVQGAPSRSTYGPYFGWLSAAFKTYPDTEELKAKVHLRDNGLRPYIELEPTDHPLALEQRTGISVERVAELYAAYMH